MRADGLRWIGAAEMAAPRFDAAMAVAGVFDLRDPALAGLPTLPPTASDILDEGRPLAGRRDHFRARRALTRHLLARWLGRAPENVVVAHDAAGAPRVLAPDNGAFVSVAARGPIAAIAVAATPIGIDIEPVETPREPVWTVLHRDERAAIAGAWRDGDDAPFRDTWIAKEAWLKALGAGLRRDPAGVLIRRDGKSGFTIVDNSDPRQLALSALRTVAMGDATIRCAVAILAAP